MIIIDPGSVAALWAASRGFGTDRTQESSPVPTPEPTPPASVFGDSVELVAELLPLVVSGRKRATAALELEYLDDDEPVPVAGDHWITADAAGRAALVLRTVDVRPGTVESVDDAFAWDEGENDRTRESWLRGHRRYFARVLARREAAGLGSVDLEQATVIFERFAVVWPAELVTDEDRARLGMVSD